MDEEAPVPLTDEQLRELEAGIIRERGIISSLTRDLAVLEKKYADEMNRRRLHVVPEETEPGYE